MTAVPLAGPSSFDRIVTALEAAQLRGTVRGSHAQWQCPAHDDGQPSLSIDHRPNGTKPRTDVHCHAGCDTHDVIEALGLRMAALFDAPPERQPGWTPGSAPAKAARAPKERRAPRVAQPKPPACLGQHDEHQFVDTTVYAYTDELGTETGRKTRRQCQRTGCTAKTFRQQVADPQTGRLVNGRPAQLYRLPDVLAAVTDGLPVYVTEGEKDADSIAALGHAATTIGAAVSGDGRAWTAAHTAPLAGADVIIAQDKDEPGRKSAQLIRTALTGTARTIRVVEAITGKDVTDHLDAGHTLAELVDVTPESDDEAHGLYVPTPAGTSGADAYYARTEAKYGATEQTEPATNNVVPISAEAEQANAEAEWEPPARQAIPMSSGRWRWHLGDDEKRRGVYTMADRAKYWTWAGPLPYVHHRIIRRSGQDQTGVEYLTSATPDGERTVVNHDKLRAGTWANALGLPISLDDRVSKAIGTAVILLGEDAPTVEATPRVVGSEISVPVPETLPRGYLRGADVDGEQARAALSQIIGLTAGSPNLALLLGASAFGPFVGALRRQAHVIHMPSSKIGVGKTTALALAASIWGDPDTLGQGIVLAWNTTPVGIGRYLGQLALLPAFFDESGTVDFEPSEWGPLIFKLTQGSSRLKAEANSSTGTDRGQPWSGVLFSTGNGSLLQHVSSTRLAGVHRRVIELGAPFTTGAAQAEALTGSTRDPGGLLARMWGHPGAAILSRFTLDDARELVADAEDTIGLPDDETGARTIAKHLAGAISGARMLDQLAGTGTQLTDGTTTAARAVLAQWTGTDPQHERFIRAVLDSIATNPEHWPTQAVYRQWTKPKPVFNANGPSEFDVTPGHGVRDVLGVQDDDKPTVYILGPGMTSICAAEDLEPGSVCGELYDAGLLDVPEAQRREGRYAKATWLVPRSAGETGLKRRAYVVDISGADEAEPTVVPGTVPSPVPGSVPTSAEPLTSTVPSVPSPGPDAPPCAGEQLQLPDEPGACPRCAKPVTPTGLAQATADGHCARPACAQGAAQERASQGTQAPTDTPQGARPAQRRTAPPTEQEMADWLRFVNGPTDRNGLGLDLDDEQARAALDEFHAAFDGLRWTGWAGDTGIALYRKVRARDGLEAKGIAGLERTTGPAADLVQSFADDARQHLDALTGDHAPELGQWVWQEDVKTQYPAACTGLDIGHGDPEHTTGQPDPLRLRLPGFVRLAEDAQITAEHLPATWKTWDGHAKAGDVLTTNWARWLTSHGVTLSISETLVWTQKRRHLGTTGRAMTDARRILDARTEPAARIARQAAKAVGVALLGGYIKSPTNKSELMRVDVHHLVIAEATIRVHVALEKAEAAGNPALGYRRDSAWFAMPDNVTPPAGIEIEDRPGKYRTDRLVPVSPELIAAWETGSADTFNRAVKAAHDAQQDGATS